MADGVLGEIVTAKRVALSERYADWLISICRMLSGKEIRSDRLRERVVKL